MSQNSKIDTAKAFFSKSTSRTLVGHSRKVHSVSWNSSGKLASGSVDHSVRIWDIEKGRSMELLGHSAGVDQLCWNPTRSQQLATASADKTVKIWDARAAKCTHNINTKGENINITWSPDGSMIAVGNKEDLLTLIDTRKFSITRTIKFPFELNEISWTAEGDRFLLTTGHGGVNVLTYPSMKSEALLTAHTANCYCIEVARNGKYFAVGGADALVSLWDLKEMICIRTFGALEWPVRSLSFSYDGGYIASASEDPIIDIVHVESGETVHQIKCEVPTNTVAWHPKKLMLAHAGDEKDKHDRDRGAIKIWGV